VIFQNSKSNIARVDVQIWVPLYNTVNKLQLDHELDGATGSGMLCYASKFVAIELLSAEERPRTTRSIAHSSSKRQTIEKAYDARLQHYVSWNV